MEEKERRERGQFSEEFKAEAVRLVAEGRRSKLGIAESLGISASLLSRWCEAARSGKHGKEMTQALSDAERVRRLEAENRELKLEREILKKAAAFFAKHQT